MSTLAKAARATFDREIGGKVYTLSPLTLGDLGQFCQYVQYRPYYNLKKSDIPEADDALSECFHECRKVDVGIGTTEFVQALTTADGLSYLLYLSLRHKHENVSPAVIEDKLTIRELNDLADIVGELSGIIDPDAKKKTKTRSKAS